MIFDSAALRRSAITNSNPSFAPITYGVVPSSVSNIVNRISTVSPNITSDGNLPTLLFRPLASVIAASDTAA